MKKTKEYLLIIDNYCTTTMLAKDFNDHLEKNLLVNPKIIARRTFKSINQATAFHDNYMHMTEEEKKKFEEEEKAYVV